MLLPPEILVTTVILEILMFYDGISDLKCKRKSFESSLIIFKMSGMRAVCSLAHLRVNIDIQPS